MSTEALLKPELRKQQPPLNPWHLVRAQQWWNYKIPLALGAAFAVAYVEHISSMLILLPVTLLVLGGFSSAAYASIINDISDLRQDKLAGKQTPMMSLTSFQRSVLLAAAISLNLLVAATIFQLHCSFTLFLSILILFAAYSTPLLRLKERGAVGVVAISLGEHVLPVLLACSLVLEFTHRPIPWSFVALLGCWSAAFGLRGIIWHQLADHSKDLSSTCSTLAVTMGQIKLRRIAEFALFPLECLFLLGMLASGQCLLAGLALIASLFTEWLRYRYMQANIMIVAPQKGGRFILFEYYQLFFPLSYLLTMLTRDAAAALLVTAFCLMFCAPLAMFINHMSHIALFQLWHPLMSRLSRRSCR